MRTRTKLAAATLAASLTVLGAILAGPALADDTAVSFDYEAGELSVSVPELADLGSLEAGDGSDIGLQLGVVTVTDNRAASDASWATEVSTTSFTTGGGAPNETIAALNMTYWSGPATATTGDGTFVPGQGSAGTAVNLDVGTEAFAHSGGSGLNSATWNPTFTVNVPATAVASTYTGTVTHSVA